MVAPARLHVQNEERILDTFARRKPGEVSVSHSSNAGQKTETRSWGRTHRESEPAQVYTEEGRGNAMPETETRSVLVVSADTQRAARLAEVLRSTGSTVTIEQRGARAAELTGASEGGKGLLVVDLELPELDLHRLREALGETEPAPESLEAVERRQIAAMLRYTSGNRRKAAQLLGLARSTLLAKIRRYGLETPVESEV
jgi:DNA-binding NtrC family response regulator